MMSAEELFLENQELIFTAIKVHFGDFAKARRIASINNMELDDLIQVGQETLWKLCLKVNPTMKVKFKGYAYKSIRWMICNELRIRGLPIKTNLRVSVEDRNKLQFHSIDLHVEDDSKVINDFFAIDHSTNVESSIMQKLEFEGLAVNLDDIEKFILIKIGFGYSEREIGEMLGKSTTWINKRKKAAINKINLGKCQPVI